MRKNALKQTPLAKLLEESRTASWLLSDYNSSRWRIRDSHGGDEEGEIDFAYAMPDGKTLLDYPDFLASIKEFAFNIRNPDFSSIQDVETHINAVQCLMAMAHGMALDRLSTFRHATKAYLATFVRRIVDGTDGVLKASSRIESWVKRKSKLSLEELRKQLPLVAESRTRYRLASEEFLAQRRLPRRTWLLPRVQHLLNAVRTRCELVGANGSTLSNIPDRKKLSKQTLYRFFQALEALYYMRHSMTAESLPERPFDLSAQALSDKYGVDTQFTPLPMPKIALHLMSQAMIWVRNYSGELLELFRGAKAISEGLRGSRKLCKAAFDVLIQGCPTEGPIGSPWPLALARKKLASAPGMTPQHAINMLVVACVIVVATFSARRLDELTALGVNDIRGNAKDGWWLRPLIEKTVIAKEWIPTPEIVSKAFEILTELSAEARKINGNELVINWISPFYTKPKLVTGSFVNKKLNEFAKAVNTPKVIAKDGSETSWHWTPHQFRRFFAVLYFYRYRGAKLEDLAYFLRHFNLDMTRRYLTITPKQLEEFLKVEELYVSNIAAELLEEDGGKFGAGKTLRKRLEDHYEKTVQISTPSIEDSGAFLHRLKVTHQMQIVPKPWVDCTCPRTQQGAETAACRANSRDAQALGPDFSQAGPSICRGCPHPIPNQHFDEQLELELKNTQVVADSKALSGTMVQELAKAKVIEIRKYQLEPA
ncbi:site-specific integrase [Paucibacter sp. M5-1]|uniref:site-specific integrase n=1 Tax=Paucibacter sp. M5-1 TaxID=3015998 RepID=UPI0022B88E03|nr:site-specific integrase [Paucibacter sp. M5-1]MCZ7884612.1 site-specific integrase [Paucibacter sp. M5-1]